MTWGNSWALSEKRGNKILLSAPLCLLINTLYVGFSQSSWVAWKPHPDGKNPRKDYAKKYLGHVYHFCTFMYMHTCVACRHKIMSNIKWEVQHYANLWLYIFVLTLKLEKIHIYPRLCYLLRGPTSVLRFSPGDLEKKKFCTCDSKYIIIVQKDTLNDCQQIVLKKCITRILLAAQINPESLNRGSSEATSLEISVYVNYNSSLAG